MYTKSQEISRICSASTAVFYCLLSDTVSNCEYIALDGAMLTGNDFEKIRGKKIVVANEGNIPEFSLNDSKMR